MGGYGGAAAEGAVADRARGAVQTRHPAFCQEGRAVSVRDQGTGKLSEPAVLAAPVCGPDDRQGRVASDPHPEWDADGLGGHQAESTGRPERGILDDRPVYWNAARDGGDAGPGAGPGVKPEGPAPDERGREPGDYR